MLYGWMERTPQMIGWWIGPRSMGLSRQMTPKRRGCCSCDASLAPRGAATAAAGGPMQCREPRVVPSSAGQGTQGRLLLVTHASFPVKRLSCKTLSYKCHHANTITSVIQTHGKTRDPPGAHYSPRAARTQSSGYQWHSDWLVMYMYSYVLNYG